MFNPDLDITCYPVQQQRFVRSGRAYLKENPSCDSLKEQRFPLEPIAKGKGGGKGNGRGRGQGRGGGRGGSTGRQATPVMTVSEMIGEDGTNEESFFEWLSSAQGDADDRGQQEHQVARALAAGGYE